MTTTTDIHTNCYCGQDLEFCTAEHCPRCGTTLHHHASVTLAA